MSVFSGLRSVGFSGSRSPSPAAVSALSAVLPLVPQRGCRVSVGCAAGVDSVVRSFFRSSSSLQVFSASSPEFAALPPAARLAARSAECVRSVAPGSGGLLVVLPSGGCPAGVVPSRSFRGCGSGSWGSAALALGLGCRVLLWLPSGCLPPSWSEVSWSSSGSGLVAPGWWLGVSVPAAVQLSLF
ncbi:MAG: hypothetical protein F6K36_22955 [Symploca sp. SIO3C6]|nr:hypothetical protein [Symploca sp. SIO3C6]